MDNKEFVLITGGSTGIGLELAKLFAKDKYNLVIVARDLKCLNKVKIELETLFKIEVRILQLDLTVDNSCAQLCDYVDKNNLYIKYLVNNAGRGSFGFFKDIDIKADLSVIDLNARVLTELSKYFLIKMIEANEGGILNISSTAAFCAGPKMSVYYASKAYVLSLTESMMEEVEKYNVKIGCLCPGAVETTFQKSAGIVKNKLASNNLMSSEKVASIGYKKFMKKGGIIIPGIKNKILVVVNKFLPRSVSRKIVMKMNG